MRIFCHLTIYMCFPSSTFTGVSKLSDGEIAGIAVGAIAAVAITCVIIGFGVKHYGKC